MRQKLIALIMFLIFTVNLVHAHPGRTDARGGHYVRTPGWGYPVGSYHYHSGTSSSSSSSSSYSSQVTNSNNYTAAGFNVYYNGINVTDNIDNPLNIKQYPYTVNLMDTSKGAYKWDWYIWNNDLGWVWFSGEKNAKCIIWREGEIGIKLIINGDKFKYDLHNVKSLKQIIPKFSIIYNDIDVSNNKYQPLNMNIFPYSVQLKNLSLNVESYDWYIWNDELGWVWFSNQENPECIIWRYGEIGIKLICNGNPDIYSIVSVFSKNK